MFKITDRATAPRKAHIRRALEELPSAHHAALKRAADHLHETARSAAEEAGRSTEPLVLEWHRGKPHLGLVEGKEGDQFFEQEFGSPRDGAYPVVRKSVWAAKKTANQIYNDYLSERLWS